MEQHVYTVDVKWTGNLGQGTSYYQGYRSTWDLCSLGEPVLACSNDAVFRGIQRDIILKIC